MTAALLLGACDTYPAGDPYGTPYPPPQDPYGAPGPYPPYPPQDPYGTPAPYPPPSTVPTAPIGACPIVSSRDWRAWVSQTPGLGSRPTLQLTGTVQAPSAGYKMEFEPQLQELRTYPVQLVARLRPLPPVGAGAQVITTHDLRWQWPLNSGPVGKVIIRCGDRDLAEVPVATTQ